MADDEINVLRGFVNLTLDEMQSSYYADDQDLETLLSVIRNPDRDWLRDLVNLQLEKLRISYYAGNRRALISAARLCARERSWLIMSDWVATELLRETHDAYNYRRKTIFDEGLSIPKGKQLAAQRRKKYTKLKVYHRITELKRAGRRNDKKNTLFRDVGKEIGLGIKRCREYYYAVKAMFDPPK